MENKKEERKKIVNDFLKTANVSARGKRREVIYGVYDSARQPLFTRIDDFLIDHGKVPLEEKTYFFHLLAVMIDAGISLIEALKMLARRTKSERFRRILNTVAFNVIQGKKMSEAMARFPDVFGEMEIGVIKSGEAAGNMEKMLFKLSEEMDKKHSLQIKLLTASIYPIAVLAVLILVSAGMLVWIIPGLTTLLMEGGLTEDQFPFATRLLLFLSNIVVSFWWAILVGAIIIYLLLKIYIGSEEGKYKWDLFKLRIPIVGSLVRRVLVLRFVSTLGVLIESGIPIIQALKIIAISLSSELYKLKTWEVIGKVQQGEKISESLADAPFLFPETVVQMIAVAEKSAAIGQISEKVAAHYDREIDNSLKRLTSLFEPILIVLVGVTVALLALAILTPIFQLSELV